MRRKSIHLVISEVVLSAVMITTAVGYAVGIAMLTIAVIKTARE